MDPSSSLFLLLLILLPITFSLLRQRRRSKLAGASSASPGLKTYPLFGHLPHLCRNRHRFLEWISQALSDSPSHTISFLAQPLSSNGIFTANPSNVEHILKTNFHNYPKGKETTATFHDFFGHGIFNSDGHQWLWQRKIASFEFKTKSLRSFIHETVQNEIVSRLLPLLQNAAKTGEAIDVQEEFKSSGFNNIFKVCFGEKNGEGGSPPPPPPPEFSAAFQEAQDLILLRLLDPFEWLWRLKKLFDVGSERSLGKAIPIVHRYAEGLIRARRSDAAEDGGSHLMSRILAADADIKDEQLRDMLINFIVAGQETTSSALTWLFWILSSRPDVEKRILDEIRSARKKKKKEQGTSFSYEELQGMQYLHAAISESMRLYPPVPMAMLSGLKDDVLPDGTFVGEGWFVSFSAYAMGRLQDLWGQDCMEYRPERWLDPDGGAAGGGVCRQESWFRYPVFNGGPRACLGREMAYLQMKMTVASVLESFEVVVAGKGEEEVKEYVPSFTLRMKGGLLACFRKREQEVVEVCFE